MLLRKSIPLVVLLVAVLFAFMTAPGPARAAGPSSATYAIPLDNPNPVYSVSGVAITPASTPTDVVVLWGSATKVVKVRKIIVSGVAASAGTMDVSIVKRTAANTGTTATFPTAGKFDSLDSANTASPVLYTANPTLGAGISLRTKKLNFGVAGAAGTVVFDFAANNDKPLILRGVTQGAAINFNGGSVPTSGVISYEVEFEEI
jgi:hypothetical protein